MGTCRVDAVKGCYVQPLPPAAPLPSRWSPAWGSGVSALAEGRGSCPPLCRFKQEQSSERAGKGLSEKTDPSASPNTHVPFVPCFLSATKCRLPPSKAESGVSWRASSVSDSARLVFAVVSTNLFALKRSLVESPLGGHCSHLPWTPTDQAYLGGPNQTQKYPWSRSPSCCSFGPLNPSQSQW